MSQVAVIQLNSSSDVKKNLAQLPPFFAIAKDNGAKLVVLPENFALVGMHETDKLKIAESYGEGIIQQTIMSLAKQFKLWVVAGTIPIQSQNKEKVRASCLVFDDKGRIVARYDKIHLFDVMVSSSDSYQESKEIESGSEPIVVDTPIGCIGLTVCYDLRFPELYYQLTEKGAEIFTVVSAFTLATGTFHWEVLLRARAIENLSYVLASNQSGQHDNGRKTYGHSMVIEPWGGIVAMQEENTGVITAEIDLQRLQKLRQEFPCNEHHVL